MPYLFKRSFSKQLQKIIFKLEEISKSQNAIFEAPAQVKCCFFTLAQPYGAKHLRRLS